MKIYVVVCFSAEDVTFFDEGGHITSQRTSAELLAAKEHVTDARMNRERNHITSMRSEFAVISAGAKANEQPSCFGKMCGRGRVKKFEFRSIGGAPRSEGKRQRGEISREYLRSRKSRQERVLPFCPESITVPWALTAGPPSPLISA
jgi:hypothetical protein